MEFADVDVVADVVVVVVGVVAVDWCCIGCRIPCFNLHLEDHFDDIRSSNMGWKIEAFPSHFQKWNGIRGCRRWSCRFSSNIDAFVVTLLKVERRLLMSSE